MVVNDKTDELRGLSWVVNRRSCPEVVVVKAGAGAGNAAGEEKVLWTKEPMPEDGGGKYGFTNFTRLQCGTQSCPPGLLASDSRLRPDRAALEAGDNNEVG